MQIDFPFHLDPSGRTATADRDNHVRELIEQLLFTNPGERVNRPTFGTGLLQVVFGPTSDELATATQFLVQGALQQWLGDVILVESVDVSSVDSTLSVTVQYVVRQDDTRATATFTREM
jgi:uncharacterized protein